VVPAGRNSGPVERVEEARRNQSAVGLTPAADLNLGDGNDVFALRLPDQIPAQFQERGISL
jgi:hypothetical protein